MKKKKIGKKILITLLIIMAIFTLDSIQMVIFGSDPLIPILKFHDEVENTTTRASLFASTITYCDGEKEVRKIVNRFLLTKRYRGCESYADDLVKETLQNKDIEFFLVGITGAVPTIEKLYKEGKLTEEEAYTSIEALEKMSGCNIQKEFNTKWNTPKEFYDLWNESSCRKKYLKSKGQF